ncbi:hypothetical protein OJAV_G00051070 [Oryzias javanicus]|uniref:EF-hand domain-containing protein n=1 Tax=Oryzias javanicus TaxID=123683 RepID=A0A437D866_ORYJA|nr:hypothetical protein OJAV_G00051070 [Oryzias javanicus]
MPALSRSDGVMIRAPRTVWAAATWSLYWCLIDDSWKRAQTLRAALSGKSSAGIEITFRFHDGEGQSVDKTAGKPEAEDLEPPRSTDTGLHYDRYLREVIEFLEKDPHFREKLKNANMDDIKQGKLSKELNFVQHNFRSKLDELKREEINRLRMLIKAKHDTEGQNGQTMDHQALLKQFEHLNHMNPHTFEVDDLDRLIQSATKDLENFDKERHDEFKRYEMMKEHERRERLKAMSEDDRKKAEQRYEEMKKKHADHPKVNHPGSEDQLKEVWQETDGLDPEDFDPKTFFKMHDSNGDGFFDESELEALFTKELEKVYNPENEEDDMVEMEEERLRMKEHVMNEVDTNKDRLVSFSEFMAATKKEDFYEKDEWETLDQNPMYTEEELREYEQHLANEESDISKKSVELQKQREELERQQEELKAQKLGLKQAMEEMEKIKSQKAEIKQLGSVVTEGQATPVIPGNSQPLPPGHQQQDVPIPGHS